MTGIDDAVARALNSITQVMPAPRRADFEPAELVEAIQQIGRRYQGAK